MAQSDCHNQQQKGALTGKTLRARRDSNPQTF